MIISAPAKLNLFLRITGKRADGYHLLESVVAFTEFGDAVKIVPDTELSLNVTGDFASSLPEQNDDNLVMRAARLLQSSSGRKQGANITLHKSIPVGAGLGGGSADAAAALRGLAQLWQVPLDAQLFQTLGSDIPACILAKPAWVAGVGEQMTPVRLDCDAWAVLLNPRLPLLTREVYGHYAQVSGVRCQVPEKGVFLSDTRHLIPGTINSFAAIIDIIAPQHNDLEAPAMALMPVISELLAGLRTTEDCALARMSGSGATCFGLYESEASARRAAEVIAQKHPHWWCVATKLRKM